MLLIGTAQLAAAFSHTVVLNMIHVMEVLHPRQAVYSTHSTSSLHHRLICTLLLSADHRDLLLHSEVRWLSEGRTLQRSSTAGKTGRHTLTCWSHSFMANFCFLSNIFQHLKSQMWWQILDLFCSQKRWTHISDESRCLSMSVNNSFTNITCVLLSMLLGVEPSLGFAGERDILALPGCVYHSDLGHFWNYDPCSFFWLRLCDNKEIPTSKVLSVRIENGNWMHQLIVLIPYSCRGPVSVPLMTCQYFFNLSTTCPWCSPKPNTTWKNGRHSNDKLLSNLLHLEILLPILLCRPPVNTWAPSMSPSEAVHYCYVCQWL